MIKKIKNIFLSLSILMAITPMIANADLPKTLYGYDDRHESLQYYDQLYVDQARSVGGIVYECSRTISPTA